MRQTRPRVSINRVVWRSSFRERGTRRVEHRVGRNRVESRVGWPDRGRRFRMRLITRRVRGVLQISRGRLAAARAIVTMNRDRPSGIGAADRAEPSTATADGKQAQAGEQARDQGEALRHDWRHSRKAHEIRAEISRANEIGRKVDLLYRIRKVGLVGQVRPVGRFAD
jgi:hypothetical protein